MAEVSRVSVFEYVILPASALWGFLLWGETLSWFAWVGMSLIALAGIVIAQPQRGQSPIAARQ
jgi:drug/metabolite transporter (DMT)-like permease